jgi:hypothetical protein
MRRQGKITTNKATKSFETAVNLIHLGTKIKFHSHRKCEKIKFRKSFLPFSSEVPGS